MANANKPMGLRLVSPIDKNQLKLVAVPASDNVAIGIGDPVKLAGDAVNGVRTVTRCTATVVPDGVVVALAASSPDGQSGGMLNTDPIYRVASTLRFLHICTAKEAEYEVQADEALTSASVGLNASLIYANPSSTTGLSGTMLDASTAATTNTLEVKIRELSPYSNPNDYGTYNKFIVTINYEQTPGV